MSERASERVGGWVGGCVGRSVVERARCGRAGGRGTETVCVFGRC